MHTTQKVAEFTKRPTRQGDPVDAEELIHRLNAYLAEEELKASRSWDLRFRRSRSRRDKKKCTQKSPSTSENTTATSTIRSNPGVMNLISYPILKYQRHMENKTYEQKRNPDHPKGLEPNTLHSTQSHMRSRRNQYNLGNFKSSQGNDENSDGVTNSPKRIFHIHTLLRHKSGRGLKSSQTSSETTTEDSRNSNEIYRPDTDNSIWLSQEKNSREIRNKSSQRGKKWDWTFAPPSKRISTDYSLDKTSVETTEIFPLDSMPGSKQKIRNGFVAFFRRNSSL
ncbi:hypothetical protein HI914_01377 [Erysiphe necator]|nr:hypothetical protein HI914_01377 [Erysiphe necator]